MFRLVLLATIWLVALQNLLSQDMKGVEGRWPIVNITPEQAREKAIEEAKREALRKAGVAERITASDVLSTSDRNEQMFNSFSSIELNGSVTNYEVVRDELEKNSIDGQFYSVVTINATVKKYVTTLDPEFKIDVRGLRSNGYRNGEAIAFSVNPNREGYLKIFLFENTDAATQLFPNAYEPNRKMNAKETVHFPTVRSIEYNAEKSTAERQEHNLLLFVYTKSDVPFYGATTYQRVLGWINSIEPNGREVVVEQLLITE
jgi:hypothetical protein